LEKPAFRSLVGKYRCLVAADGFSEWTVGPDGKQLPIHFRLLDGRPFGFADLPSRGLGSDRACCLGDESRALRRVQDIR
jgi:putative SOS response-associated peptidase YedK